MRRSGDLIDRRPKTVAGLQRRGEFAGPVATGRPVSEKENMRRGPACRMGRQSEASGPEDDGRERAAVPERR